ncbi:MAG TPA: GNAT family N-acetyltransferase [Pirellulales bacterium]|nr:GNAT family N-acetyltransferase [Pirellulales bacterium]
MSQTLANRLATDFRELIHEPAIAINLMRSRSEQNDPFYLQLTLDFYRETRRRHSRCPLLRRFGHGVATCVLPESFNDYFMQIEASARRNFKKASRSGFTFSRIDYNQFLDDVSRIRHSAEYRQGKLPKSLLDRPVVPSENPPSRSPYHDYPYFGVLRDGKLYAYAGCLVAGEVCIIETIYGDAAVQPEGIVPMLIISIAGHLLKHYPAVKYYCYGTYFGARDEMRRFKRKFNFLPHRIEWQLGPNAQLAPAASESRTDYSAELTVRAYAGRESVGALATPLCSAGLLPATVLGMDPEYLADGREGHLPQALVAYANDIPIGYLPFVVRPASMSVRIAPRRAAPFPYRQLRLLGYQAAPTAPASLPTDLLRRATAAAGRYHLGIAAEIPIDNPLADAMLSWQPRNAHEPRVKCTTYNSFRVEIAGTFEDFLRFRFNPKSRSTLRRKVRRFAEEFKHVDARLFTGEEVVTDFLRDAEIVARQTYQWTQGLPVIKRSPDSEATLRHLARRGLWRAYILYADGEPCAYCQGSVYRRIYDYDVLGFNSRYSSLSPGMSLLYFILEDLFSAGLVDELDFGAGPAEYKRRFATRDARVLYAKMYSPRAYTSVLKGLEFGSATLATTAKWVLRQARRGRNAEPAVSAGAE